jgi:acyl carrier protein
VFLDARLSLSARIEKWRARRIVPAATADERADFVVPVVRQVRIAQAVARAWQDVLVASVRGPEDDFFDAGGDSLKAITLTMELERALGLELSPTLIYEVPEFDRFCEVLRAPRAVPRSARSSEGRRGRGARLLHPRTRRERH